MEFHDRSRARRFTEMALPSRDDLIGTPLRGRNADMSSPIPRSTSANPTRLEAISNVSRSSAARVGQIVPHLLQFHGQPVGLELLTGRVHPLPRRLRC